jgi:hypothetical protein
MMSAHTSKRFVALVLPSLLTSGCAHYPVNAPLAAVDARSGYRFQNPSSPTRYWSAPKADNCGGDLVNQTAFL